MEERDIAIQIEGLCKRYRLGTIGGGTLRGDIESWWARKRGKDDPNSIIGSKAYSKNEMFYALDGVNLTIYKGERVGIIGHNGAGKSTLLKLLSRVTAPTEGQICLDGRIASMLEVGTGFNGELTGRENIYLNGAILGMTKDEVDAKMDQIIDFSEVRQFIDTPVKRYSSGMYVKLAFSVAAHLNSEIMIMDEVLAVGDMAFQKKCLDKMNDVSKKGGRTVLYVSHNMSTIRQLCERVIVLDHGSVVFDGNVEDGIAKYISRGGKIDGKWVHNDGDERIQLFGKATINEIALDRAEQPVYEQLEPIRINIKWKALKNGMRVFCRVLPVLFDDTVVGVSFLDIPIVTESDCEYSHVIECHFDGLIPGKYYLNITLFEINSYGTDDYVAVVKKCVSFEMLQNPTLDLNIRYDPKKYDFGKVRFPNAMLFEEKINDEKS